MAGARDVICPYCFETWSTSTAAFRCLGRPDDATCPRVPDHEQAALLGGPAPLLKKVVVRTGRFGRAFAPGKGGVSCDCGARTTPVCPNCHSALPHGYADGGDRLIGMVGTKASGKSHFIAVLMHELFQGIGSRYGAVVELLDDDTRRRFEQDLIPRVYDEGLALLSTTTAAADDRVSRPLGMRLSFDRGGKRQVVNTVFFDTAGEDLAVASVLGSEARYVGQCAALILLVDPLQITAVRDLVGTSTALPDEVVDPLVVLRNVTELLRRERGVPTGKLDQPLAIAFSKLDAIRSLFEATSPVVREPAGGGAYDLTEGRSIGAVIRANLIQWMGPEFDAYVTANYAHANYFALSALGGQPVDGRLTRDVAPHRVADPLLWVLSEWQTIPVVSS